MREEVEAFVGDTKGKIRLISTALFKVLESQRFKPFLRQHAPPPPPPSLIAPSLTWSCTKDKELLEEAQRYLGFKPLQVAPDVGTIIRCSELVHGKPVTDEEKCSLLANLQNRRACQALALAIARCLGWGSTIDCLGLPEVEQGCHGADTNWRTQTANVFGGRRMALSGSK